MTRQVTPLRDTLGWRICAHARMRAREFAVPLADVLAACVQPDVSYPSGPAYPPGRQTHLYRDFAVVVAPATHTVVTVLPRIYDRWEHGEPGKVA